MSQIEVATSDILIQFLEVAFHSIIYFRRIYPNEIFVGKKIYGTAVHISIHPELNEYLKNVLVTIKELMTEDVNSIKSINLTIINSKNTPVEKYVFDLLALNAITLEKDPYFLHTEEALRTVCLKISMCESYLKPIPENASFYIDIITYESTHVALNENSKFEHFPWIVNENENEMKNTSLLPLKTIKTEHLTLQMYAVEDTITKSSKEI